jgi:hypothetical protein
VYVYGNVTAHDRHRIKYNITESQFRSAGRAKNRRASVNGAITAGRSTSRSSHSDARLRPGPLTLLARVRRTWAHTRALPYACMYLAPERLGEESQGGEWRVGRDGRDTDREREALVEVD